MSPIRLIVWSATSLLLASSSAGAQEGVAASASLTWKTFKKPKETKPTIEIVLYATQEEGGRRCASTGAMSGVIKGVPIMVVDLNNNGRFNDLGKDGVVLGATNIACYLSRVVNLGNELFEFAVNEDGNEVTIKPYQGETGTLDLKSGFKSSGTLEAATVADDEGKMFFNAAQTTAKGLKVPAGNYKLLGGFVRKGNESAQIKAGHMGTLAVAAGLTQAPRWGSQLIAEFTVGKTGEKATIAPESLHYFGQSGEEYYNFQPVKGKSPKFVITDNTGKLLGAGRFEVC